MKFKNYPTIDNGFVYFIDYEKLIKMQSQEPIITTTKKVSLKNESQKNNAVLKRSITRTTNK